jgi:nitrite reductase/ring-hydroxylating ferredoxin subunit
MTTHANRGSRFDGFRAELIGYGEPVEVPVEGIVERVTAGDVIVLRGCLQELGYLRAIHAIIWNAIARYAGIERAKAVRGKGYEYLHLFFDGKETTDLAAEFQSDLSTIFMMTVKRIVREVLGIEGEAFAEDAPNIRAFVPQDRWTDGREAFLQFEREKSRGKVTLHGPHNDLWGYHPRNVINVWTAIAPVLPGNGMSFWPDLFNKLPPMGEWHIARKDQFLGKPFGFALDAGDALLFHMGQMHGSRINQTAQTRIVCSARFTTGTPVYVERPWHPYMPVDEIPDGIGKTMPGYSVDPTRPKELVPDIDTSRRMPTALGMVFDSDALGMGEMRPLNEDYCVARTPGQVVAFSRRCPHEGSDLAAGYVQGGSVYCPWHNLEIDLTTGQSPCRSLRAIHVVPLEESQGLVTVAGLN